MDTTLQILRRLTDNGVEFVIVGGIAAVLHGSAQVTQDTDVCAPLTRENVERIILAIRDLHPRWRMSPGRPALPEDPDRLATYKNLYLLTDLGQLDILTEITGLGSYRDVLADSQAADIAGVRCRLLGIESLIRAKQALGRPRDLLVARELQAIRERQKGRGDRA